MLLPSPDDGLGPSTPPAKLGTEASTRDLAEDRVVPTQPDEPLPGPSQELTQSYVPGMPGSMPSTPSSPEGSLEAAQASQSDSSQAECSAVSLLSD